MRKILLLYLLFFSGSSFAVELSDDEKRAFIESLAIPSHETRVFYRWQSDDVRKKLLEAGEMTPELYERYVGSRPEAGAVHLVGRGLYVAADMFSSENYGETVVKVEVKQGYPFIDLDNAGVQRQLQKKGISPEEAYRLKPRVAVKDYGRDEWWCLKRRRGLTFKPVSGQELMANFKQAPLSPFTGGAKERFFNLLSPQDRGKLIDNIEHFIDGFDILFIVTRDPSERMEALFSNGPPKQFHFSRTEVRAVVNATLPYITNVKDGVLFLEIGWQVISKEDKEKIMDKILPLSEQ